MMRTLALFFLFFSSMPLLLNAQSAAEMLQKVSAAMNAGQNADAVTYFRQAVGLDVDRAEMFYWTDVDKSSDAAILFAKELAATYRNRRNYDKAYLFYKELLQRYPDDIEYLCSCAEMQVCRGEEKDASRLYEKVLQLDADNLSANIFLGNYYYLMGEQAKKKLDGDYGKIAAPTKMQYARYRDGLSRLFTVSYEKARRSLQKVMNRFPSVEARKTLDKILKVEKEVNR